MLITDPDPDPIRIQCYDQKMEKCTAEIFFLNIKKYNLPIPRPA
jgi:hypothetical protein